MRSSGGGGNSSSNLSLLFTSRFSVTAPADIHTHKQTHTHTCYGADDQSHKFACFFCPPYNNSDRITRHFSHYITVSQKTAQLWNDIARNCKDQFWWYLAEIFKRLQNRVCMFQFSCRFAFLSMLLVKFGTVDMRPGSGRRMWTDENVDTVNKSLLLNQEDKPQSHRTVREISHEEGDPSIISFSDYSQIGYVRLKCCTCKKRRAQQLTKAVCSLRDDNVITSKPTWKLKHANSILESFEYFCQISSKSIHIISSYTVSKLGRFLRHSVYELENMRTLDIAYA